MNELKRRRTDLLDSNDYDDLGGYRALLRWLVYSTLFWIGVGALIARI